MSEELEQEYCVVVNDEEQYSLWPTYRAVPAGWRTVGVTGSSEVCLKHIEAVWTDMRPLSLRRTLEDAGAASGTETGTTQCVP